MSQRVTVAARQGGAVRVRAGQSFRVIDVEGRQCADLFAFCANDVTEYASAEHTRPHVNRLFPQVGEHFVTNRRRPILFFAADHSPGIHDMLVAACDPSRYVALGVEGWHASCQENLLAAMRRLGFDRVEVPQPINLFTNIPLVNGRLDWRPALTRPGDSVTLRAELDCHVVVSSCPNDVLAINDKHVTSLAIEVLD
jgi:uncharacterized protein